MLKRFRERAGSEKGFTLIELLVVMLILGILAAIAIPAFFNQRNKATDAQAKTYARTAETAMETSATDNNGSYAAATVASLQTIEPTLTNATLTIPAQAATSYTIDVASTTSPVDHFQVTRAANGSMPFPCTVVGSNGCPASGFWNK